jgi:hypothetical protein
LFCSFLLASSELCLELCVPTVFHICIVSVVVHFLQKEAAWCLSNLAYNGSPAHRVLLVKLSVVQSLASLLGNAEVSLVNCMLDGLESLTRMHDCRCRLTQQEIEVEFAHETAVVAIISVPAVRGMLETLALSLGEGIKERAQQLLNIIKTSAENISCPGAQHHAMVCCKYEFHEAAEGRFSLSWTYADILQSIFEFLNMQEMMPLIRVSRAWRDATFKSVLGPEVNASDSLVASIAAASPTPVKPADVSVATPVPINSTISVADASSSKSVPPASEPATSSSTAMIIPLSDQDVDLSTAVAASLSTVAGSHVVMSAGAVSSQPARSQRRSAKDARQKSRVSSASARGASSSYAISARRLLQEQDPQHARMIEAARALRISCNKKHDEDEV